MLLVPEDADLELGPGDMPQPEGYVEESKDVNERLPNVNAGLTNLKV